MKQFYSDIKHRRQLLLLLMIACSCLKAQVKSYDVRLEHARDRWMQAIPNLFFLQYAGNIGFISTGIGWDYGKHEQWETHLLFGYLPSSVISRDMVTMTLRESFIPWEVKCGHLLTLNPILANLSFNTIFDTEFWITEKERYPGDYYRFSSKVRAQMGIGGRLNFHFTDYQRRQTDRISIYYELSTYDLALISVLPNKTLRFSDTLALGLGIQYKFF